MKAFIGMQTSLISIYLGGLYASSLYGSTSNLNAITKVYRLTGKANIATNQLFTALLGSVGKDYVTLASKAATIDRP